MKIKRFQQGGAAPAEQAAQGGQEAQGGQPGAEEQIMQMAQQIIEQLGPEAAAMLAQVIVQMLQSGQQQGGQPQPAYQKKGGKLVRVK